MRDSRPSSSAFPLQRLLIGGGIGIVILFILMFLIFPSWLGYWLVNIDSTEVGILTKYGSFVYEIDPATGQPLIDPVTGKKINKSILGPGQYTDIFNLGANIDEISVTGFNFSVTDPQVALAGPTQQNIQQTIGVTVAGTVFRPGLTPRGDIPALSEELWRDNRPLYTNDDVLRAKIEELAKQALKVCVGPRTLAGATVGSERNDLAGCIDEQLTTLAAAFALDVRSVTVPDIILPPEVEQSIKDISAANQNSQLAIANATLAYAQGQQQQAIIVNAVQVTAAAQQAQIEAKSTQAAANKQLIEADREVAGAQATNDAAQLNYDLVQAQLRLEIARLDAQAESAQITRLAELYQANPQYAAVIIQTAFAQGLAATSKVFYIPTDTKTLNVIGGVGGTLVDQDGNAVQIIPNPEIVPVTP